MKEMVRSLTIVFIVVLIAFGVVSGTSYFAWKRAMQDRIVSMNDKISEETISFSPDIDLLDEGAGYLLEADLPGLDEDSIEVKFIGGELIIAGYLSLQRAEIYKGTFIRRERDHGRFSRRVWLPEEVDISAISAKYERGILAVILPKGRSPEGIGADTIIKVN